MNYRQSPEVVFCLSTTANTVLRKWKDTVLPVQNFPDFSLYIPCTCFRNFGHFFNWSFFLLVNFSLIWIRGKFLLNYFLCSATLYTSRAFHLILFLVPDNCTQYAMCIVQYNIFTKPYFVTGSILRTSTSVYAVLTRIRKRKYFSASEFIYFRVRLRQYMFANKFMLFTRGRKAQT